MRLFIVLLAVVVLVPAAALAHDTAPTAPAPMSQTDTETSLFTWPALGISLEHPTSWSMTQAQGFDFVLVVPHDGDAPSFLGVQSAGLPPGESVESVLTSVLDDESLEVAEDTFGGVDALTALLPPNDNDQQIRLTAFTPDNTTFVLLVVSTPADAAEALNDAMATVLASVEVEPLALDTETLNAQLQTSLAEEERLLVGPADAPLWMIEAFDFSCPHCVDYAPSMARVVQDYVQTEQMQLELLTLTFVAGERSMDAAMGLYCGAELGIGWDMHKAIYGVYQTDGGASAYTVENIVAAAEALDADANAFETCMVEERYLDVIDAQAERAGELGVSATPTLLLGDAETPPALIQDSAGNVVTGAIRLSGLYPRLDEVLAD